MIDIALAIYLIGLFIGSFVIGTEHAVGGKSEMTDNGIRDMAVVAVWPMFLVVFVVSAIVAAACPAKGPTLP